MSLWTGYVPLAVLCISCTTKVNPPTTCGDEDTRQCVGAAACAGGQRCIDGRWSACDCGSTGRDAGADDAGPPPEPSIDGAPVLDDCNPQGARGPVMMKRQMPDGRAYCIDTTEVSVSHYSEFLLAAPNVAAQTTDCVSNTTSEPSCLPATSGDPDEPMTCVDWCDAVAYCTWAGKRLCELTPERIPELSEPALPAIEAFFGTNPGQRDEWMNACSAGGTRRFAYGDDYDREVCAGSSSVRHPGCADTAGELFGLSAGVAEWAAPCWAGRCFTRGRLVNEFNLTEEAFDQGLESGLCELYETHNPDTLHREIGLRCCMDPLD